MRFIGLVILMFLAPMGARAEIQLKSLQEWGTTPLHFLYSSHENNVIYGLYVPSYYQGFTISVHYFEDLLVTPHNDVRYDENRRINFNAFTYHREGDRLIYNITQEDPIRFESHFEVTTHNDMIIFDGWIHNRETDIDWHGNGLICFRLRENYDFYDLEGKRTFLTQRSTGERVSVFDAYGADSSYFFIPTMSEDSQYLPGVEKEDKNHHFIARIETTPANDVGGNRSIVMSCLHCDMRLDVAAGEMMNFHTEVSMTEILPNIATGWTLYH